MKQLFFLVGWITATVASAQTNTFNGAIDSNWNVAGNWSLNTLPGVRNDVVIPADKAPNLNVAASIKSLQVLGMLTIFCVKWFFDFSFLRQALLCRAFLI
jgi:hypothetical protein